MGYWVWGTVALVVAALKEWRAEECCPHILHETNESKEVGGGGSSRWKF